jgi:hypothetical protein
MLLPGENDYLNVRWERSGEPSATSVGPGKR